MRRFLLCSLALLLALALHSPALHAQIVEIYGTATGLYATNVPANVNAVPVTPSFSRLTSLHNIGLGAGATINFINAGPLRIGVDGRGSEHLALGGVKASLRVPILHLTPYVQGSIGYLNLVRNNIDNKYTAGEILAGVDVPVIHHFDLRLVEVGLGHALNNNNNSKPTFITASSGIVFHF